MVSQQVPSRRDARPLYYLFSATAAGQAGSLLAGVTIQRVWPVPAIVGVAAVYLLVTLPAFLDPWLGTTP